jgi:hypothetical protein
VTRVCSETLAVGGPPRAHNLILGSRKDEIAVLVELDLGQGPFLEKCRTATVSFFEGPNGAKMARTWPDNRIGRILDGATKVFEPVIEIEFEVDRRRREGFKGGGYTGGGQSRQPHFL